MFKFAKVILAIIGTAAAFFYVWLVGFAVTFEISTKSGSFTQVNLLWWTVAAVYILNILLILAGVVSWWQVALKSLKTVKWYWRVLFYLSFIPLIIIFLITLQEMINETFFVDYLTGEPK